MRVERSQVRCRGATEKCAKDDDKKIQAHMFHLEESRSCEVAVTASLVLRAHSLQL